MSDEFRMEPMLSLVEGGLMRLVISVLMLVACGEGSESLPVSEAPPNAKCLAGAAAVYDGIGYLTIQAAIDDAIWPATVEVCPGTWYENLILPAGIWTLEGLGEGADRPVIDGSFAGSVIDADLAMEVTLQNLRILHGAGDYGGGLFMQDGSLTLTSCVFAENSASSGGGGLGTVDADVAIHSSEFSTNTNLDSGGCGGGAWFWAGEGEAVTISIDDSIFGSNDGAAAGGGVCAYAFWSGQVDLEVAGTTFKYNVAELGAGLTLASVSGTFHAFADDVWFLENDGGGAYLVTENASGASDMDADFLNTVFDGNYGGGRPALTAYELGGSLGVRMAHGAVISNIATAPATAAVGVHAGATLELWNIDMGSGTSENVSQDFYNCAGSYGAGTSGMIRSGIGDWCP